MDKDAFRLLLEKAFAKQLSASEREAFIRHLAEESGDDEALSEMLRSRWSAFKPESDVSSENAGRMLARILEDTGGTSTKSKKMVRLVRWGWVSAACIAFAIMFIMLGRFREEATAGTETLSAAVERNGIHPGSEKATIYLSDGSRVVLGSAEDRLLAFDQGVRIVNLAHGVVAYEGTGAPSGDSVYNTVVTPKGGEYKIVLEDGTKVHLNAESRLEYPVRFSAGARQVRLVGEGYFEVAKDSARPFFVSTEAQTIQVLGTVFNVNAYPGGSQAKTTLLEGRVDILSVKGGHDKIELNPGQAALTDIGTGNTAVLEYNLEGDLAWHHGYFVFNDESIVNIMARIARWYDIDIIYEGDLSEVRMGGIFQRSKSIVQLLESFQATGLVDFSIEERRVTVMGK